MQYQEKIPDDVMDTTEVDDIKTADEKPADAKPTDETIYCVDTGVFE